MHIYVYMYMYIQLYMYATAVCKKTGKWSYWHCHIIIGP